MNIGILGSGMVGQALAQGVARAGHHVMIGTREPAKLSDWQATVQGVQVGTFGETAAFGEILFNAVRGVASLEALKSVGTEHLDGKILIDVSNPLDFSQCMPPFLSVVNTDSLGEQIQKAFPNVKVVKALNTVTADLMTNPNQLAAGDHHMFMSGNDSTAKATVANILTTWFGWKHVLDLGDISMARGMEMYLALWVRLWGALGKPMFNIKVVE